MTAAPFCNACGARFESDDQFCANCGAGRPTTRPLEERSMSQEEPTRVSRWDRYQGPANDFGPGSRPYAHIAAGQQPAQVVDDGPGWLVAGLLALVLTVLLAVYLNSQQGEAIIRGQYTDTTIATGPTTSDIVADCLGSFVGLVVTLRAFFALLNIESALRR